MQTGRRRHPCAAFPDHVLPRPDGLDQVTPDILEEVNAESLKAFSIMRGVCARFMPVGGHELGTAVMVWSPLHGYATLFSNQPDEETPAGAPPDFARILPDLPPRK